MPEDALWFKVQKQLNFLLEKEVVRYAINGLFATAVHYLVLVFNMQILQLPSAGIANLIAAVFGITASFLGSRYFVFRKHQDPIIKQAVKFSSLYAAIAVLHGLVLYVWSDVYALNYHIGFLVATVVQVLSSYFGNKILVFK